MASDGGHVFILGGNLPPGAQVDEAKVIHVLDTSMYFLFCHFIWTAFKFKTELLPGKNDEPRRVLKEDDHSENEGSAEDHAKVVAPDVSSEKEIARLEHERIADLERLLSEALAAQTERDRHAAQLTDELSQKSALLEQAEEAKERAGVEVCGLRAELDESLLSRDHALEQVANAVEEKNRAGRELRELRAKLDESLLSRDHALEQAEANAAEEKERTGLELHQQIGRKLSGLFRAG